MTRTQIQLTESQASSLKKLAARRNVTVAELIRQAIDDLLHTVVSIDSDERKRRALAAAGRFHSGETDLSATHDRYLAQAFDAVE
jgi:hypothetical protein